MVYRLPDYSRRGKAVPTLPPYAWDDWDPYSKIALPDPGLKARLVRVSNLGITAFALGCAEWVVGALPDGDYTPQTYNYLEAFWVYAFGFPDAVPPETEDGEWKGPIKGAINLSLMTVLNTILLAESGPPAQNGAFAARISEHVVKDTNAFQVWQKEVVDRLNRFCMRTAENEEGSPVPREILNTSQDFDPGQSHFLVQAAVGQIDFARNPLLGSFAR